MRVAGKAMGHHGLTVVMALPRPLRDAIRPMVMERLTPKQKERALKNITSILTASEDLSAMGEERGGMVGNLILGFATAIRDRANQLKETIE